MTDAPLAPLPASRLARLGRKSLDLLRRHKRAALMYGASVLAAKVLDKAHAAVPDNTAVSIADTVMDEIVGFEDMLFFGGLPYIAKTSASAFKAPLETSRDMPMNAPLEVPPVQPVTPQRAETATPESPHAEVSSPPPRRQPEQQGQREAAFLPVVMPHRRHHAALMRDDVSHDGFAHAGLPQNAAAPSLPVDAHTTNDQRAVAHNNSKPPLARLDRLTMEP